MKEEIQKSLKNEAVAKVAYCNKFNSNFIYFARVLGYNDVSI